MSIINRNSGPRATEKQQLYIEQLAIDLTLSRIQRNDRVSSIVHREVKYLDELSIEEASNVIEYFRVLKYGTDV